MFITRFKYLHNNIWTGVGQATGPHSLAQLTLPMNNHGELVVRCPESQADDQHFQEAILLQHGAGPLAFLQEVCKGQSVHLDFPFSSYYFARSLRPCRSFFLLLLWLLLFFFLILAQGCPGWPPRSRIAFCLPNTLLLLLIGCRVSCLPSPDRHWSVPCPGSEMNQV